MIKKFIRTLLCMFILLGGISIGNSTAVVSVFHDSSVPFLVSEPEPMVPPPPGDLRSIEDLPYEVNLSHQDIRFPHQPSLFNLDIVEVIQQMTESLLLGYVENLTAFGPRVTGTTECTQAATYIYNEFENMGLTVRYHNWSNQGYAGSNIEGTLLGTDQNNIFIICAHYDTVAGSPGADDDGSGTALVLAAANILSKYPLEHTVRFVAFSGEEQGLLGSYCYAEEAYQQGVPITAVLNADMISFAITKTDGDNVEIYENEASEWIVDYTINISEMYQQYIELTVLPQGPTWGSDHYYFWEFGYDAVFYFEDHFNEYYHSPEDTIEHMNFSYYKKTARLVLATLAALTQQDTPELQIGSITGGFSLKAEIKNIGALAATDVNWSISVTGGILGFINREGSGTFDILVSNSMENVTLKPIVGLGRVNITVSAEAPLAAPAMKTMQGFVLLVYVVIQP